MATQGLTCYQLLVHDKPAWLGPRLLQKIMEEFTSQCKKESEHHQIHHRLIKRFRDDNQVFIRIIH